MEDKNEGDAWESVSFARALQIPISPGEMGLQLKSSILIILAWSFIYASAEISKAQDFTNVGANYEADISEVRISTISGQDPRLCTLCEEFTAQALDYLNQNKTQDEIVDVLHQTCSRLHSFKQQCVLLVDYYAPLFFLEIGKIKPENFCKKVDLCERVANYLSVMSDESCTLCQQVLTEILGKLKDPETQLQVIEILLKACNRAENFAQQCKKLVFEYGPVILINAEKFLEKKDLCAALHLCKTPSLIQLPLHQLF